MDDRTELTALRRIWRAFVAGVVVLGGVLTLLATSASTVPALLPLGLAAGLGAASIVAVTGVDHLFAASPPENDEAAVRQLRGRLLVQSVIAAGTVLACTVIAFVFGPRWAVAVGVAAALVALLRVRPTWDRLGRFDDAWGLTDHDVSLRRALRQS